MKFFNAPRIAVRLGETKNKTVGYLQALFTKIFSKSKKSAQMEAMRCYAPPSLLDDKLSADTKLSNVKRGKGYTHSMILHGYCRPNSPAQEQLTVVQVCQFGKVVYALYPPDVYI